MKTSHWMGMLFAGALVAVACGDETSSSDDDDGTGGTTSSTSSSSGTTSSSSSSSGSTDCGTTQISDEAACQTCLEGECCAQLLACDVGTDCANLMDCAADCDSDDQPCIDGCLATYAAGQPAYAALWNCLEPALSGACSDSCASDPVCNADPPLYFNSDVLTECVNDNCCDSFDPCAADIDCNACLQDSTLTGCDTNTLLAAYETCMDANCPMDMCDTGIGWYATDENDVQHPMFDCNECSTTNCCTDLVTCVGGTVPDPPQAAVDLCLDCLTDPNGTACTDAAIGTAAAGYTTCKENNCATECNLN